MPGGRTLGRQLRAGHRPELQERDLTVFRMLAKARVLTSADFVPTLFPSLPVARRRLRKLTAGKYIAGYVPALHQETRYVLDRKGMIALVEIDEADIEPRSAPKNLRGPGEHRLTLVRFWSRVVHECHEAEHLELRRFAFEWEMFPFELGTVLPFKPDAVLQLEESGEDKCFLIEVDQGTESPSYFAKNKIEVFSRLYAAQMPIAGEVPTAMLVTVPTQRRMNSLARAMPDTMVPMYARVFTTTEDEIALVGGWKSLYELKKELSVRRGG